MERTGHSASSEHRIGLERLVAKILYGKHDLGKKCGKQTTGGYTRSCARWETTSESPCSIAGLIEKDTSGTVAGWSDSVLKSLVDFTHFSGPEFVRCKAPIKPRDL